MDNNWSRPGVIKVVRAQSQMLTQLYAKLSGPSNQNLTLCPFGRVLKSRNKEEPQRE